MKATPTNSGGGCEKPDHKQMSFIPSMCVAKLSPPYTTNQGL